MNDPEIDSDTLSDAITTLRRLGFTHDFTAHDGMLRCEVCQREYSPSTAIVEKVVRFEGMTDPGDESILFALTLPCDHRGIYSVAYGTYTPTADVAVVRALRLGER
jgi:hypothetical protein